MKTEQEDSYVPLKIGKPLILDFVSGFVVGKTLATLIELYPYLVSSMTDPVLFNELGALFLDVFVTLTSHHVSLAIIGGLIVVVWRSEGIFE